MLDGSGLGLGWGGGALKKHRRTISITVITLTALMAPIANAQQSTIGSYSEARDKYFWRVLYTGGGETLYCDKKFTDGSKAERKAKKLSVEHVFPAQWIAEHFGCANRNTCSNRTYKAAEGDLHNLWPALTNINSSRGKQPFGELAGEDNRRFEANCTDYERSSGANAIVEPRDEVKGDIARSVLYMAHAYCLVPKGDIQTLFTWSMVDPVDDEERRRNDQIEVIQHSRNPLIDDPWAFTIWEQGFRASDGEGYSATISTIVNHCADPAIRKAFPTEIN
jgi:deoxyribonuclease I